eukprot:CAMPEP_0170483538 /NCGR_PEP_ID=MMETSP0208-20121228/3213_1 /TAXON_ID=197538 /ORGANISM="Strombidium inclinatum, Strain S3" /LENGTH=71 /DNA_ID=CAMNT_0010756621 /DNA_START=153 /DNA_END=368 /DNA_ORIENTATION=-
MRTYTIDPKKTCEITFQNNTEHLPVLYFAEQNNTEVLNGKFGKYISYTWDKFVWFDGMCVYDSDGYGGMEG